MYTINSYHGAASEVHEVLSMVVSDILDESISTLTMAPSLKCRAFHRWYYPTLGSKVSAPCLSLSC